MTTPPATRRGLTSFWRDLLQQGRLLVALFAVTRFERQLPPGLNDVHTPAGDDAAPATAAVEPRAATGACGG